MENYKIVNPKSGRSRLWEVVTHVHSGSTVLLPTKQTLHVCFSHVLILQLWMVTILLLWGRGQETEKLTHCLT